MTVAPLIYPLPALLGYLLFVGISGRFDPMSRPERRADRPSWLLGLWSGLAVAFVLLAGLVAQGQSPVASRTLLTSSGWGLAMLMLPGLALWYRYRGQVAREESVRLHAEGGTSSPAESSAEKREEDRGAGVDELSLLAPESTSPVAAFLSRVTLGPVEIPDIPVAPSEPPGADERRCPGDAADVVERSGSSVSCARGRDPLGLALREERRLRAKIEKHLRIIRRALGVLADESGRSDRERLDVFVSLEEELEGRIRGSVATEAALDRETARCAELERKLARLSRDTLSAQHAARRGDKARARAVKAATRSLTLAREAIRTRALAEERLHESEAMLAARQATIGNLVSALEQARSRSRSTASWSAAPVTNETSAGKSAGIVPMSTCREAGELDAPAVTVDKRLGVRLARKAARVRPLSSRG